MEDDIRTQFSYQPIGYIRSVFPTKNGTPRQSGLSELARASLTVSKDVFTNPDHSLQNLSSFSHVWLIWVFHLDTDGSRTVKAKVAPPRLGGERVGVFSSRSPHRPANIGLTLASLDTVLGDTIHVSGVDLVDGTPVLDIKPYIPQYDSPQLLTRAEETVVASGTAPAPCEVRVPAWVGNPEDDLSVIFSNRAETSLANIDVSGLRFLRSREELRSAIVDVLSTDPRSVYRKTRCSDRMYFTTLDGVHVTAWYDPDIDGMEVIKVKQDSVVDKDDLMLREERK